MKDKPFWKSKTIYAALAVAAIAICKSLGVDLPYEIVYGLCAAFGLYGVRDAVGKLKK